MNRDELQSLRDEVFALVEHLRKLGDFDANARSVRLTAEACLQLTQHLLDRLKR